MYSGIFKNLFRKFSFLAIKGSMTTRIRDL